MFTKILAIVTNLIYAIGFIKLGFGIMGALSEPDFTQLYFGKNPGQMMDSGLVFIIVAMVLTMLIRIDSGIGELLDKKNKELDQ
jgi:hypothetical protein